MSVLYVEKAVGFTGYSSSGPDVTTLPPTPVGTPFTPLQGWEPQFHQYRNLGAQDVFVSYDGSKDAFRLPAGAAQTMNVSYKSAWLRAATAGGTAAIGVGFYTKQ